MVETKRRRKLNAEQIEVLELLHKFRFGSNDLIARYFGKRDRSFVFKRLSILLEQGLIGKRFESRYRLRGKPAAYYLLPTGARVLQELRLDRAINIKALYKDKTVGEDFVENCLSILNIYCQLKAEHGDRLKFFTKVQLAKYDYFSEFIPSAYFRLDKDGAERDYFLEYFQDSKPFFAITRRLKEYIEYADSGEWEDATNSLFPEVLLVCDKTSLQNRLLKKSASILAEADDELKFFVSTKDSGTWFDLAEPDTTPSSSPI